MKWYQETKMAANAEKTYETSYTVGLSKDVGEAFERAMEEMLGIDTDVTGVDFLMTAKDVGEEYPVLALVVATPVGNDKERMAVGGPTDITSLVKEHGVEHAFQKDLNELVDMEREEEGTDEEEASEPDYEGMMQAKWDYLEATGPEGPSRGLPGMPEYYEPF